MLRLLRKVAVTLVGVAVLAAGVAMLALPGPGILVLVAGFAILATEYDWARRALAVSRARAQQAAAQASSSPLRRTLSYLSALALVVAGVCWVVVDSLPLSSPWVGGGLVLGGVVSGTLVALESRGGVGRAGVAGLTAPGVSAAGRRRP